VGPSQATYTKVSNPYSPLEVDTPHHDVDAWLASSFSTSLPCLDSVPEIAPRIPTPPVSPSGQAKIEVQKVIESLKLRAAALGAGLVSKRKGKNKISMAPLPTLDEAEEGLCSSEQPHVQQHEQPHEQQHAQQQNQHTTGSSSPEKGEEDPSCVQVGQTPQHISSPDQQHFRVSINHLKFTGPCMHADKGRIQLELSIGDTGYVKLHLHVFEQRSHVKISNGAEKEILPPTGPFHVQEGKTRKVYKLPYYTSMQNWSLQPHVFESIMYSAECYDRSNGHVFPLSQKWTDAFSDPVGANAKCPQYWSQVVNAFKHQWKGTNVYGFPPMNDDLVHKTLMYHTLQQRQASSHGKPFRGIYVVPYKPSAPYWKLTSQFQVLKLFGSGSNIFAAPAHRGRSKQVHKVVSPVTMCVLYDPGYTTSNNLAAYMYAMEQCSESLSSGDMAFTIYNDSVSSSSPHSMVNDGGVGQNLTETHCTNNIHDQMHSLSPKYGEGNTGDSTNINNNTTQGHESSPEAEFSKFCEGLEGIKLYNTRWCQADPEYLPEQMEEFNRLVLNDEEMRQVEALVSASKLSSILEHEGDPDWQEIDKAILEHLRVLRDKDNPKEGENNYDPSMFNKSWVEGGYLPIQHVRQINQEHVEDSIDDSCLVIKTKVLGKYNNSALIDEGAGRSVLNVDWYESQGIDWRKEFAVPDSKSTSVVYMANLSPVTTYGTITIPIEIKGTRKVQFHQTFQLLSLGANNYAQILGFDWKKKYHSVTFLPEYTIKLRKLDCEINAYPMPLRLYQIKFPTETTDEPTPTCEEVTPKQILKDIKLLSARPHMLHVHVPPTSYLRQILVRPAHDEDQMKAKQDIGPEQWNEDVDLEARAVILRARIEETYWREYTDVLDHEHVGINTAMPHEHIIEVPEGTEPFSRKLKRLSPLEMELLNKYITEMVGGGRIRPSDSPWGANVLFVPKPCGGFRCCQDYRELNKRMKHDTYPLPRIDVHMDMAQGSFWSKMDLLKGFYQLPMHKDSIKYTAFNTLVGKFEFLVMPMGLQSAPGSFM